jgi:hypothetical protein
MFSEPQICMREKNLLRVATRIDTKEDLFLLKGENDLIQPLCENERKTL